MRPTSAFISGMATMGVLATGIVMGTDAVNGTTTDPTAATTNESTSSESSSTGAGESSTATVATPQSDAPSSSAADGTFTGETVQTRYGPMQIEIVISKGVITEARALQTPGNDPESVQINSQVVPILIQATADYQSVKFGNVTRATISTNAYKQSAQSALDQAGFTG